MRCRGKSREHIKPGLPAAPEPWSRCSLRFGGSSRDHHVCALMLLKRLAGAPPFRHGGPDGPARGVYSFCIHRERGCDKISVCFGACRRSPLVGGAKPLTLNTPQDRHRLWYRMKQIYAHFQPSRVQVSRRFGRLLPASARLCGYVPDITLRLGRQRFLESAPGGGWDRGLFWRAWSARWASSHPSRNCCSASCS